MVNPKPLMFALDQKYDYQTKVKLVFRFVLIGPLHREWVFLLSVKFVTEIDNTTGKYP